MAQVLYRKYRSKSLDEIVGQEHITKTLSEALKSGRLSHAYLFTGPRGVGKTSIARILAHEVNGLEYNSDQPHVDIIEIDAASNRRIDEIRDLRDKVHISPASAQYKVYIIDEVHMLTKEAFNALLKTLEEPPAHVIFILATTDPHKLPDTIISRTQRFSFKPIDEKQAVEHLRSIAKSEKIKVNDQALELIAKHGEGSFRDSISLLDQLSSNSKEITEDSVRQLLGVPPLEAIDNLIDLIDSPKTSYKQLSEALNELFNQGFSASLLAKQLMNSLRDRLINNQLSLAPDKALSLLNELLGVDSASDSVSYLLLSLMAVLTPNSDSSAQVERPKEISEPAGPPKNTPKTVAEVKIPEPSTSNKPKVKLSETIWPEILNELKNRYNTLYGIVRMAQPVFKDNNQLDLIFDFAFHKKQVAEPKNKQLLANIILELTGSDCHINCFLREGEVNQPVVDQPMLSRPKNKDLDNINKIFGGGEVVD